MRGLTREQKIFLKVTRAYVREERPDMSFRFSFDGVSSACDWQWFKTSGRVVSQCRAPLSKNISRRQYGIGRRVF